ncbi:MAG: magnesium transporter CorA family protein [bacterium]
MRIFSNRDGHWGEGDAGQGLRWYDLCGKDEAALRDLGAKLHLHPLAIDDCLSPYLHTPKLEDFGEYLFVILADLVEGDTEPTVQELNVFLGKEFLLTYHDLETEPSAITALVKAIEQGLNTRQGTSGLLYEVADRTVDAMLPTVTKMSEDLDVIEDHILVSGRFGQDHRQVMAQRSLAGKLRRLLTPELQYMIRLGRGEFAVIDPSDRPYFRDVYDHLLRVDLTLEALREDTEVALNMYLSALNNKMNEVMKVLAVVSALALPGTLITGIFGTNFDNVPGLHSQEGFLLMIVSIAGVALGMAYFFKRRHWF